MTKNNFEEFLIKKNLITLETSEIIFPYLNFDNYFFLVWKSLIYILWDFLCVCSFLARKQDQEVKNTTEFLLFFCFLSATYVGLSQMA